MIVRRGVEFWVLDGNGQKVLGKYKTKQMAADQETELLLKSSPNGIPAKSNNARLFIVTKQRAPTLASAMALVRKNGGVVRGARQTATEWRFKQAEPEAFEEGSTYTEELEAGVFVVLGKRATQKEEDYSLRSAMSSAVVDYAAEANELFGDGLGAELDALFYSLMPPINLRPAAFGGAFAYDGVGALVGPEGQGIECEAFPCEPYGTAQFLRTGSGFWRQDHGEPFAIDVKLLKLIFKNTQLRGRPLRGDYMHWTNLEAAQPGMYRPCGWVDPADLYISKWRDPMTKEAALGIFGPVAWEQEGATLIQKGLNQISPVIDWQYTLRHDTPTAPAGTYLGPTIIKFALVDEGFFWMDAVRLYKGNESRAPSFIYRERQAP